MCAVFGAQQVSLMLPGGGPDGYTALLFVGPNDLSRAYGQHFGRLDPFRRQAELDWPALRRASLPMAQLGQAMLSDRDLIRTEFYSDYCRPLDRRHTMGGMLGNERPSPIGLHRAARAGAFGAMEQGLLDRLLPHLQRALGLRRKLGTAEQAAGLGLAALEALGAPVMVLDHASCPVFVSPTAEAAVVAGRGLRLTRHGGPFETVRLEATHRGDDAALRLLVAATASGGPGGILPLHSRDEAAPMVLLMSPLPARLAHGGHGVAPGLVFVTMRGVASGDAQEASVLAKAFGLSPKEAEVAAALAHEATLEEVAALRGVGLETVRSQARAVLRKTGAENLRAFRRLALALRG